MNPLRHSRGAHQSRRTHRPRAFVRGAASCAALVGAAWAQHLVHGEARATERPFARVASSVATTASLGDVDAAAFAPLASPVASPVASPRAVSAAGAARAAALETVLDDTLSGRSGKLRARFVVLTQGGTFAFLRRLLGDTAAARPGVYTVAGAQQPFAFITMRAFEEKIGGRIGRYRIGFWPGERRRATTRYQNPAGFIEVTPQNQLTYVSEHFKLADFLTHDQQSVWPKYLVLREPLLDKLELVIAELRTQGYDVKRMHVMSGFRTPQYNASGGETSGRATLSRHQYGDAADVWVENGAGRMADLNRDGRVDTRDAEVVAAAAERVERSHPELVGGIGIYRATPAHGPFVHIDVRGSRARWGSDG